MIEITKDRQRFLEKLTDLASIPVNIHEAARDLRLKNGQALRDLLDSDPEALRIWDNGRHDLYVQIKRNIQSAAAKGSGYATRVLAQIMRDEGRIVTFNPEAMTTQQLVEVSGRSRQTIHRWCTKHRLPRNPDGTFNLTDFIFWLEKWTLEKARKGRVS